MRDLAGLYADGLGVPKDLSEAHLWYQKAANADDDESKKWLASHPQNELPQ